MSVLLGVVVVVVVLLAMAALRGLVAGVILLFQALFRLGGAVVFAAVILALIQLLTKGGP